MRGMVAKKSVEKPILRGERGYFLEGTAAGPGRPIGSKSIKDAVRQYLVQNPEDFEEFITHFAKKNRELAWQMLEGRPSQGLGQADDLAPLQIETNQITIKRYDKSESGGE